jgi:hypothetical protein
MTRRPLPNRRDCSTFSIEASGMAYTISVGKFPDGSLAEIFIASNKQGSHADTAARDSAVVASIALQYGVPLEVLRKALLRNSHGVACGPLGRALDYVSEHES